MAIPRQHRGTLTIACDARWDVIENLPRLVEPMHFQARFQGQDEPPPARQIVSLSWPRPPVDVLRLIDQNYQVKSFELTIENGR